MGPTVSDAYLGEALPSDAVGSKNRPRCFKECVALSIKSITGQHPIIPPSYLLASTAWYLLLSTIMYVPES